MFYKPLPYRTNLMLTQRFGIQLIIDSTGFCINTFGSYRLPTQFDMYNITLRVFFNKNAKKKGGGKSAVWICPITKTSCFLLSYVSNWIETLRLAPWGYFVIFNNLTKITSCWCLTDFLCLEPTMGRHCRLVADWDEREYAT